MAVVDNVVFDILEKLSGKNKIVECLIGRMEQLLTVADPFAVSFVEEYDILADSENGVHVVSVDDRCDSVLMSDV